MATDIRPPAPHSVQLRWLRLLGAWPSPWLDGLLILGSLFAGGAASGVVMTLALVVLEAVLTFGLEWSATVELERDFATRAIAAGLQPDPGPWQRALIDLTSRALLPSPELWINAQLTTQMATFGRVRPRGALTIDGGAARALSSEGRWGMLAHELGHLAHHDTAVEILARLGLGASWRVFFLSLAFRFWSADSAGGWLGFWAAGLALLVVAWTCERLALVLLLGLLRAQERRADTYALALVRVDDLISGLSELEDYKDAVVRLQVLLDALTSSAKIRATLPPIVVAELGRAEALASALWDGSPPSRETLELAGATLASALSGTGIPIPPPKDPAAPRGDWRQRLVARLIATHLPHRERLAALRAQAAKHRKLGLERRAGDASRSRELDDSSAPR